VSPGTLFEEIGFNYIGLIDGHNAVGLVDILKNIKTLKGPQLLHIVTQKGKGYLKAENDPFGMHAMSKIKPKDNVSASEDETKAKNLEPENTAESTTQEEPTAPTYSQVFGNWLCDRAAQDPLVVGVTPAMGGGSGMERFAEEYPDRFHDVAIAEQHAVTFAAGMACDGLKPIVAIYSTFLQRAYDQLIHDIALQNLNVLFAIDRAGLVGEDGPTHAGSFDLSFLRCIPNMIVMAPSDENETHKLLNTAFKIEGPTAVRYPRGKGPEVAVNANNEVVPIGKGISRREGKSVAILAFGSMVAPALNAANRLNATIIDMRFVKPLDENLISDMVTRHQLLVTVEENAIAGGAGSAVNEFLLRRNYQIPVLNLGLPDEFTSHGKAPEMLSGVSLDSGSIEAAIKSKMVACKLQSEAV
jgi:1-deoxy-D-xylulose-5-phosphate synthase